MESNVEPIKVTTENDHTKKNTNDIWKTWNEEYQVITINF